MRLQSILGYLQVEAVKMGGIERKGLNMAQDG